MKDSYLEETVNRRKPEARAFRWWLPSNVPFSPPGSRLTIEAIEEMPDGARAQLCC